MINKEGRVVSSVCADFYSRDGLFLVAGEDGKCGYADSTGRIRIELGPNIEATWPFVDGMARVKVDGKWGFIDTNGKMVIAPQYERVENFFEGLAGVKKDDKWGFVDKKGRIVVEPQFDEIWDFSNGLALFRSYDQYGYIDKNGSVIYRMKVINNEE